MSPRTDTPGRNGAQSGQSWLVTRDTVDMTRPARPLRPLSIAAEPQNIMVDASQVALADRRHAERFLPRRRLAHSRGIDITPNRKPIEPLQQADQGVPRNTDSGDLGELGRPQGSAQHQPVTAPRPQSARRRTRARPARAGDAVGSDQTRQLGRAGRRRDQSGRWRTSRSSSTASARSGIPRPMRYCAISASRPCSSAA